MITRHRGFLLFAGMAFLLILVSVFQSWQLALTIFNLCVISAVMQYWRERSVGRRRYV